MNNKTFFITGGGTGGHIYPAITIAEELLKNESTEKIYYIGNPNNLEFSIVKDKNYTFLPVISSGMPRKIGFPLIKWAIQMFHAFIKCCSYIRKYKPDIIFGTGGYVSAPVLMAGIVMKVPFVMHDCDANPGLVTRELAPYAKSVSVAFEEAKTKLHTARCIVNGNPIRHEFAILTKEQARKNLGLENKLTLCIMGGSQGAKTINDASVQILKKLTQESNLQVIFQTGKKNYDEVVNELKNIYPEYEKCSNLIVRPYFDDMVTVLKASDIAITRAGSLSISELCASAIAPIFVPYPYAAADHQRKNAKNIVAQDAGLYIEDSDVTPESLLELIKSLADNPEKLDNIQKSSLSLAKFDGTQNIVKQILEN